MKKPLAPTKKQSGPYFTQPQTNPVDMGSHMGFCLGELLPLIRDYANTHGYPQQIAVVAAFLVIATEAQCLGIDQNELVECVKVSAPPSGIATEAAQ